MDLAEYKNQPDLLVPAGNIESFFAALDHGADAVYVGYRHHNARAMAANFNLEEISRLNEYAHAHGVKLHVALNALAFFMILTIRLKATASGSKSGAVLRSCNACTRFHTSGTLSTDTLVTAAMTSFENPSSAS